MNIKAGDMVTLKPMKVMVVYEDMAGFAVHCGDGRSLHVLRSMIASVEPAPLPLKVGDRVRVGVNAFYEGKILAVDGDFAWIKVSEGERLNRKLSDLTRIGDV